MSISLFRTRNIFASHMTLITHTVTRTHYASIRVVCGYYDGTILQLQAQSCSGPRTWWLWRLCQAKISVLSLGPTTEDSRKARSLQLSMPGLKHLGLGTKAYPEDLAIMSKYHQEMELWRALPSPMQWEGMLASPRMPQVLLCFTAIL